MSTNEEIIKVENLKKVFKVPQKEDETFLASLKQLVNRKYATVTAVDNISMCIKKGEIRALIGPNGSGKSTTIKILTGTLFPTEGSVMAAGYIPWKNRKSYVRNIGVVAGQRSQLMWDLPPIDTFSYNREVYRIPRDEYDRTINEFNNLLDLSSIISRPVRQLSLGERMKCELVCALLHSPEIVYLDEPTIGLDINAKTSIHKFIKSINEKKKTTFILTTHDLDDVENLCENITVINKGSIVYSDSIKNLKGMVSGERIINLVFNKEAEKDALKDCEIIEWMPLRAKIKVDLGKKNIQEVISTIVKSLPCVDIMIESIGIEEIISRIYTW
ncbi:MAG TPA: ATP-binding cassette domain-containing protein [Clostridia bacterium]